MTSKEKSMYLNLFHYLTKIITRADKNRAYFYKLMYLKIKPIKKVTAFRDHPLKTSAFLGGRGQKLAKVKNWKNLPTESSKKLPKGRGRGQKL